MQENLIKLHSIILDGDLTEAAKLCDELVAAQQGVRTEVPYDNCLNDLGWDMHDFLTKNGATFDGRVFNNMKQFLKECIEKWLTSHPQGLEQDATRYRALCSSGAYAPSSYRSEPWGLATGNTQSQSKESLDAAVDAYIAAQAKQGE